MDYKVKFTNVTKKYSFHNKQIDKLKDILFFQNKTKQFYALKDITFEVSKGESIGIIGINGSGKSTLSSLLAQVLSPTQGTVEVIGEPSLIAISAGLNNNLTGYENIRLKCLMLGMSNSEINELMPNIIEFADIGDFISQPLKNYSSGMKSRLGFSISVHTDPDVIIIDEALSVGDQTFYDKCLSKINEFKAEGKTIFFISHSISQMQSFSDRVMWLHYGQIKEFGEKNAVLKNYNEFIKWFNSLSDIEKSDYKKQNLKYQFEKSVTTSSSRSKNKPKKKSRHFLGFLQLSLIFLLLGMSLYLMFNDNKTLSFIDLKNLFSNADASENDGDHLDEQIIIKKINKNGWINNATVKIYADKDFSKVIGERAFADIVNVRKKINNSYEIDYNQQMGYISENDVKIFNADDSKDDKYALQDILEFSPETFNNAYEYYLAHLGLDYEKIEKQLKGLTNEFINESNRKVLEYEYDDIAYIMDENGIAQKIVIFNINTNDNSFSDFIDSAILKGADGNLYFLEIDGYSVIVNKNDKTITLDRNE
ncbi:ATP-binding cassette domain-containing protein [Rossellomorea vietnamensis]|uniref:ATP-binding cassette domain-containing protein n=1 Tax=Rossellomorea vietnamensis TaxID=218284 RepID=UPI000551DF5D|nr:ATP-binding cassette domain-containing protein [Rossellomorea vietnamensis]